MADRIPFGEARKGETITFDAGYYMTGKIVRNIGTYDGKRMVEFAQDGNPIPHILSYAAHRSVRHG